jgi:hypothetical protein
MNDLLILTVTHLLGLTNLDSTASSCIQAKHFKLRWGKLAGFANAQVFTFSTILIFTSSFLPHHFFLTINFAMTLPLTPTMHNDF